MKQIALDIGVLVGPRLANFHPGHNTAALSHLELWMAGRTRSPVPTYLWGDQGSGKTHLLKAVAHHIEQQGAFVGWMDKTTTQPDAFNPDWEVLLLDDVQQFSAIQQHMAFNWFVNAATPGAARQPWVLAAGSVPPQDLPLREDLRTRLAWGLVYQVQGLSDEEKIDALSKSADARGLVLSPGVLPYLLTHSRRDMQSLSAILDALDRYSLETQRPITMPLLRELLQLGDAQPTS